MRRDFILPIIGEHPRCFMTRTADNILSAGMPATIQIKDDWDSMRTLYVLTKDFETYTEPQKLFNFTGADENMAIIVAIIRKVNGVYYAILKDDVIRLLLRKPGKQSVLPPLPI